MRIQIKRSQYTPVGKYLNKWLFLLAAVLIISGVFAFGLITLTAGLYGASIQGFFSIWMVGMIPLMFAIAVPITVFIARTVHKHFSVLSKAMDDVANGKTNIYIPITGAGAFTKIYEDFNKMTAEILGIQHLRDELVDGFSHELKTPVASINGFARILMEENITDEKRLSYLNIIVRESDRLAGLAKSNLLLSKIDTQEIITDKKPYNLGQQLQEIAISMESAWTSKNINLTAELSEVIYNGNPDLMESLWQNLLSNAIKFTPKNGDVSIDLKEDLNNITVIFTDTGIGMSEEVKKRIFDRYYQGDASRAGEGHGLGLSIVKRIIKLCGGKITVASKVGEGSIFTVIIPKA